MMLFLPAVSALVAYLRCEHVGAWLGLDKLLALAAFGAAWAVDWDVSRSRTRVAGLLLFVSGWSGAAGFSSLALVFALASILFFKGQASWGRLLLLSAVFAGPIQGSLIEPFRDVSIQAVDVFLRLAGLAFERTGITYRLDGHDVLILERCSGASTTRVFLVLLLGLAVHQGARVRDLFLTLPLAAALGLLCNTLRISAHLLLSHWQGHELSETAHSLLGLLFFALLLFGVLRLTRPEAPPSNPGVQGPPAPGGVKGRSPFLGGLCPHPAKGFRPLHSLVLIVLLMGWPMHAPQDIGHAYELSWTPRLERAHVNRFVERRGGGGWLLLEHPIELCLAAHGWDLDRERQTYGRLGQTLRVETVFRAGVRRWTNRWAAALERWLDPRLWARPLEAEIRIVEQRSAP